MQKKVKHNKLIIRKTYKTIHCKANNKVSTNRVLNREETYKSLTHALLEIVENCLQENKVITNIKVEEDEMFDYLNIYYDTEVFR